MKKVNNSQKAFLKQLGKYGGFSSAQQSLSGGLGKYTGYKLEKKEWKRWVLKKQKEQIYKTLMEKNLITRALCFIA